MANCLVHPEMYTALQKASNHPGQLWKWLPRHITLFMKTVVAAWFTTGSLTFVKWAVVVGSFAREDRVSVSVLMWCWWQLEAVAGLSRGSRGPKHHKLAIDTRLLQGLPGSRVGRHKFLYVHFTISSFLFPFFCFIVYVINNRKTYNLIMCVYVLKGV